MKPGIAPAFRQSLAALVVLASSGCSQVATAPHAPLPPTPAPSPAPVAIRTPEPIPPATVQPKVEPALPPKVILDNSVLIFSPGGWKLAPPGRKTIKQIVAEMRSLGPGTRLVVTGYSSSSGTEARKRALSKQRAEFVAKTLTSANVPREKITVRGLGAENPVASNATKDGRLKNQRVEVEFQVRQESLQ